ncbi:FKBP-type peptidyl-prolyl cis-trans isomerase/thiol-disulfide isomerase/thioredoxin [Pedobacter cryoconitis]|uniref:peptidylprolyl isomerase n=1 Tax=Pedobacter cryoconitis TaxID=188932 RepID=A0A7W8ZPK6_9SPHI|nr:FKBP-type peptidyl-prolyl cis-trans isomerase [Pedobacter cryoconitis]MBB5637834.1 FKBP-type peptidyl-prolyl cis-trans isomerase/thiol-disulfide isomerase/thioredoxin [Pedobacter cryoconitis]MBB6270410.1 FKBP-type peptidyl-prolyl cis-trans isomerase/thiol-disulfide isomerase/thioredoxin [Pedobacter cryoconitis]
MIRYILIAVVLFVGTANAQDITLNIGDRLPDFSITKFIGSSQKIIKTSDFKNRLLIIDFWATNCPGCVEALSKMEALQNKFGDKIKILPVTYEPAKLVTGFWKNNKYTKNLTLTTVVDDKMFSKYFKHQTIPHEVWVYKEKVIAITTAEYVDTNNIQRVLNGEKTNWPVKNDFYVFDSRKQPLFNFDADQIDTNNTSIQYAAISNYKEGVNSEGSSGGAGIVRNKEKKNIRTYFLNQPIFTSYMLLLNRVVKPGMLVKPGLINSNEVIWEVKDPSRYIHRKTDGYLQDWMKANAICYESINPDTGQTDEQIYKKMISDLNALLGLKVRWEKRNEKVWILIKTGQPNRSQNVLESKGEKYNPSDLVYKLNQQEENPYVFDGSKSDEVLNLNIKSWADINALSIILRPLGYDLKSEEREVDKLVFSEVNGGMLIDANMQITMKARKDAQKDLDNPSADENLAFLELNKKESGVKVLPSGLQYKIIKEGNGIKPLENSRVSVHYTGMLTNGRIFDSSYERGDSAVFSVSNVIKGWTEALQLMPVGSRWILYIPSKLAYRDHTANGTVPPNSTLIFEIELLGIIK